MQLFGLASSYTNPSCRTLLTILAAGAVCEDEAEVVAQLSVRVIAIVPELLVAAAAVEKEVMAILT